MPTNKNRMWIVETGRGIAYIGRDPAKVSAKAQKGHFWLWASRNLGYPVIFKDKATAQKFARKVRRSKIKVAGSINVIEVEFYKGEMEG